jgi:glycerol kinase
MQPAYLGALDQGTTSTRFLIFDRRGRAVASAQREHEQIYPHPGQVEHDPLEILRRSIEVMDEAAAQRGLRARDLAGIGITNQRETALVWDRHTGLPIHNALVWQDTRVAPDVDRLRSAGATEELVAKTGLPLSTYFSALKLSWLLRHIRGARERAERGELLFGNMDAWLLWNLTGGTDGGVHLTDVTNASRTQLMHLEHLDWDDALLTRFGIPRCMLPAIRSSSEHYGNLSVTTLAGVPLTGILGDQQAALVGQTCFAPGEAKNTYGTGCFLLMNTGTRKRSTSGLLTTVAYQLGSSPAVYALEGSIAITGALVQWLRDNLGLIPSSESIEALALAAPDNGGVYFVPAFSGLYAPYWDDRARGLIIGLTRYAGKAQLARAVLEATAFQTREVVEAMEGDAGLQLNNLRTDGGMVQNELLMQFQADILDRTVVRPATREVTALGAAYAAALAVGYYGSTAELKENWEADRHWRPQMNASERETLYGRWKQAVQRSLGWL